MKSLNLGVGIVVASLAFAGPAFAQKPESGGSSGGGAVDRSTGVGATSDSGGAVDRGGGSAASGSVSSVGSGATSNSPSANAASSSSISLGDGGVRQSAPQHRTGYGSGGSSVSYDQDQKATPRASGPSGGSGSGSAVSRGGGSSGGESTAAGAGTRSGSGDNGASRAGGRTRTAPATESASGSNNESGAREVPTWSRPRGDRPATGTAVDRTTPRPDRNGDSRDRYGYGGGYYDPYSGYGYGNGYGYNNYYGNYYYPYGFGMGYGLYSGLGWSPYYGDPFGGDPYGYGSGGGGYSTSYGRGEQGNLKLRVKPRAAKVYVDGYFVGFVDQFDGAFQKLALNTGRHKVAIQADGFEAAEFDVLINPEQTVTFQGELKRIQ